MNLQDELQKIHHQWGTSEKANYEIELLFNKQLLPFITKSEKWDVLDDEISKYYENGDDENEDDEDDENDGSLLEIGEAAAIAFGYL